jgi:aquaporin related protein
MKLGKVVPAFTTANRRNDMGPNPLRGDIIAALGEFVGMTMFIFLALSGVQAALNAPYGPAEKVPADAGPTFSQIQSVAFSFSSAITVALFICAPISGGALNPAVLLSLLLTGNVPWFRGLLLFIAEIVGAILGAYFSNFVTANTLLGVNKVSPGFNNAQAFFAEALMTCSLCLTILFIIIDKNVLVTFAPFVVGMAIFICHMIGTPIDGTSINPARSFGPAVVTGVWTNQFWIFWIGPLVGSIFAVMIYMTFKALQYDEQPTREKAAFRGTEEPGATTLDREKGFHNDTPLAGLANPDDVGERSGYGTNVRTGLNDVVVEDPPRTGINEPVHDPAATTRI